MNRVSLLKSLIFLWMLAGLSVGTSMVLAVEAGSPPPAPPVPASGEINPLFAQIFTEKVLTVTRESDGFLPGTLRTALIQAGGIRNQNAFSLVRIVFDPSVRHVLVNKGPLPEVSGSLTTIDCQIPQGRVLIEGSSENAEGADPTQEIAGLKLTSNGNAVRNCHLTGFRGPGILIRGNRNQVEDNTLGYHKEVPESAVDSSGRTEDPKTNQGAGVFIGDGSSENTVQNNEIVANAANGVELSASAGTGNKIIYNFFAKNSGKTIKVAPNSYSTRQPQITKILQQGDLYLISGLSEANADLQIYMVGKEDTEVGMIVVPGAQIPRDNFTIETKSKGFIPNQTKIIALAHGQNRNTSEFSNPIIIPGSGGTVIGTPEGENGTTPATTSVKPESNPTEPNTEPEIYDHPTKYNSETNKPAAVSTSANSTSATKASEPETVININGMGDHGREPETGGMAEKNSKFSSVGF